MKYISFNLSDKTPVKFKIRKLNPYGLDIAWKYTDRLNFAKYIDLYINENMMYTKIELLQQLSDNDLINEYKDLIEEEHILIKNRQRII